MDDESLVNVHQTLGAFGEQAPQIWRCSRVALALDPITELAARATLDKHAEVKPDTKARLGSHHEATAAHNSL